VANRGLARNPVIVLRPSRLIGLECDTPADFDRLERLRLPVTVTVRSSETYKRHFYFRPAADLESLPFVAFRFESGKITADATRYFVCPPARHPSGATYAFLPGLGLDEIGFAELPAAVYRQLASQARASHADTKAHLQENPDAKVLPGHRRDLIFRYCCALRRWTADRDEILQAALTWNERHCDPPVDRFHVEVQVDGAMRKPGSQAFGGAA
jgi:Bifunctional DNA primase/polymerase, N-terminal